MAEDSEQISMELHELRYAADKFHCSKWEVLKAIEEGGLHDRDDIHNYIMREREREDHETGSHVKELFSLLFSNRYKSQPEATKAVVKYGYVIRKRV